MCVCVCVCVEGGGGGREVKTIVHAFLVGSCLCFFFFCSSLS